MTTTSGEIRWTLYYPMRPHDVTIDHMIIINDNMADVVRPDYIHTI